jgi:hypothetical protein
MIKSDVTERTITFVPDDDIGLEGIDIRVTCSRSPDGPEICLYFADQLIFVLDGNYAEHKVSTIAALLDEASSTQCTIEGKG